jgi:hypothetical protein
MRRLVQAACALAVFAAVVAATASADDRIRLGYYSQQVAPHKALIGAGIERASEQRGRTGATPRHRSEATAVIQLARRDEPRPRYLTLPSSSPLLANPAPLGAGTFWYSDGLGHACIYLANSTLPCYAVTSDGATPSLPPITPAAIAAAAADRLDLVPGRIETSPQARGLTGAGSWFWLSPSLEAREVSVALAGQTVTVMAQPSVEWRFGDGSAVTGGSGVAYRPGPAPDGVIVHVYETRCLPGDRGRNPYILANCGDEGYRVEAVVHWRITYRASGRIDESGTLPVRTTETAITYPVTEARAFLTRGGSG